MKKTLFIIPILFCAACANQNNGLENALKSEVFSAAGDVKLEKYKTESISFIDTVTVAERKSEIEEELKPYHVEKNLDEFTERRNQEFKVFRRDPSYEEAIMRGNLKDASPWCTELRIITEKADSLIENWDKVSSYDYDYMYLNLWYINRAQKFYDTEYQYMMNTFLEEFPSHKSLTEELKELSNKGDDEVLFYVANYIYSFYNPFVQSRVRVSKNVTLSPNMEIIQMKDEGFTVIP